MTETFSENLEDPQKDLKDFLLSLANMQEETINGVVYRGSIKGRRPPLGIGKTFAISPSSCIENIHSRYPSVFTDDLIRWLLPKRSKNRVFTDDHMHTSIIIHIFQRANIFVRDVRDIDAVIEDEEIRSAIQKLSNALDSLKQEKTTNTQHQSTADGVARLLG